MSPSVPIVTVLGDSRVFDTYYTNSIYPERYGYDATFPFLMRGHALAKAPRAYDVVHIPDHFRGGTVENNIVRLALTDPAVIVLCDGIWETLVHKDWFIEWATQKLRAHATLSKEALDLSYSSRILADLFVAGELPVSPQKYAAKQRRIISYFRRRRRQCVWMSLTTPPREHLDRLHYAGNFRCIPEWDDCLKAINDAMRPLIGLYGADWLDLDELAAANGGFAKALIDQWHFSRQFHAALAEAIASRLPPLLAEAAPLGHVSREFLLARPPRDEALALFGPPDRVEAWLRANPDARVEAIVVESSAASSAGRPLVAIGDAAKLAARCIVLVEGAAIAPETEMRLLKLLPRETILVYPEEIGPLDNPLGVDRAQHGKLRE